jgi:hypothetical protein
MTTYTMTIEGLSPKQLLTLLDVVPMVPLHVSAKQPDPTGTPVETPNGSKRMTGDTVLVLTGKSATDGTVRATILEEHEKLEAKHGIGTVTRKQLRTHCGSMGIDSTVIGQLIKGGFLKPIGE